MQAIRTRYIGPGNVRGSAMSVQAEAGRMRVEYDDRLSISDNHRAAVKAYMRKHDWPGTVAGGQFQHDWYWSFCNVHNMDALDIVTWDGTGEPNVRS